MSVYLYRHHHHHHHHHFRLVYHRVVYHNELYYIIMFPTVEKRAISVAFVRPSVCPFVAYIANNSRTQRPIACPNLEQRFSTLDTTFV